mmetsp:Transcript_13066/g.31929  ORF Transcript_13066/g.31929 Transcript_13066/m.31929 type:complete len:404 (-) Transcript_13066:714-1925(-)
MLGKRSHLLVVEAPPVLVRRVPRPSCRMPRRGIVLDITGKARSEIRVRVEVPPRTIRIRILFDVAARVHLCLQVEEVGAASLLSCLLLGRGTSIIMVLPAGQMPGRRIGLQVPREAVLKVALSGVGRRTRCSLLGRFRVLGVSIVLLVPPIERVVFQIALHMRLVVVEAPSGAPPRGRIGFDVSGEARGQVRQRRLGPHIVRLVSCRCIVLVLLLLFVVLDLLLVVVVEAPSGAPPGRRIRFHVAGEAPLQIRVAVVAQKVLVLFIGAILLVNVLHLHVVIHLYLELPPGGLPVAPPDGRANRGDERFLFVGEIVVAVPPVQLFFFDDAGGRRGTVARRVEVNVVAVFILGAGHRVHINDVVGRSMQSRGLDAQLDAQLYRFLRLAFHKFHFFLFLELAHLLI